MGAIPEPPSKVAMGTEVVKDGNRRTSAVIITNLLGGLGSLSQRQCIVDMLFLISL